MENAVFILTIFYLTVQCIVQAFIHLMASTRGYVTKHDMCVQVESLSNVEEVELRAKIEALGLEVTKVPPKPSKDLGEVCLCLSLHLPFPATVIVILIFLACCCM